MKKSNKKKGILIGVLALVLLIPLAVITFIIRQNLAPDLNKGSVSYMIIEHDGVQTKVEEKETVSFFKDLAQSGNAIESPAHDLSEYRLFTITFHKLNRDLTVRFYLSDSVQDCVYNDFNGHWFLIDSEDAATLLAHPQIATEAVSFAFRPHLVLAQGGTEYAASQIEGEWNYYKTTGEFDHKTIRESNPQTAILPHGETLNFSFSMEPDFCSVLLTRDSEILFSGDPADMEPLSFDHDTALELVVTCDWYEKEGRDYYGSLEYTFNVLYDVPTTVTLLTDAVLPGEEFDITVIDSSSESIAVTPTFPALKATMEQVDGVWHATVPVAPDATSGEYSLMILGSDVEQTVTVHILSPDAEH